MEIAYFTSIIGAVILAIVLVGYFAGGATFDASVVIKPPWVFAPT